MNSIDRIAESRWFWAFLGVVLVLFVVSVCYEWYTEGFLPFGPSR